MNNLKALRGRIKSIKSTKKITKAMQMVAASKLRLARNILEYSTNYFVVAHDVIHSFVKSEMKMPPLAKALFKAKDVRSCLAIIITSDKGLCGSFNHSILKFAKEDIENLTEQGVKSKIITIGKKAKDAFAGSKYAQDIVGQYMVSDISSIKDIYSIYEVLREGLESGTTDSCRLYFNSFKNTTTREQKMQEIAPIRSDATTSEDMEYEYDGQDVMCSAIEYYLTSSIYNAFTDSRASEESSRMIAMDSATRNAGEMVDKLTLLLNRSRQAHITNELIEIISGAEAV